MARINFLQAICILDFYHAAEHLSLLSDSLYGDDTERAKSQAKLGETCSWRTASRTPWPRNGRMNLRNFPVMHPPAPDV